MKKTNITGKLLDFSFKTASQAAFRHRKPFCSAILAAGGHSSRMGQDKLLMELDGKPVILYSLLALQNCDNVDEIIVVCSPALRPKVAALCSVNNITKVVANVEGGDTRFDSVSIGLKYISHKAELIAVHDAARPFATTEFISRIIAAAKNTSGVVPAVAVKDTIKVVNEGTVASTPDRSSLYAVQTPQVFDADLYKAAVAKAAGGIGLTDDSMAVEAIGGKVSVVPGDENNIKLTTPFDFRIAQLIITELGNK